MLTAARVPKKQPSKRKLAAEVWRRLFDFLIATRAQREQVLGQHGLTPNDARALSSLGTTGRTMRALAAEWVCDPSNATWVVDRLEKRRLAERLELAGDRRVKLVALTPLGVKTKATLREGLYRPPPELLALGRAELEALLDATAKLSPVDATGSGPSRD